MKTFKEKKKQRDAKLYRELQDMVEKVPDSKGEIYRYLMRKYRIYSVSTIYNIIREQELTK